MRAGVKNSGKSVTEILINENHMKLFDGRRRHEEHRHHAADLFRAAAVVAAGLAHGARRMAVQPPGIERRGDVARRSIAPVRSGAILFLPTTRNTRSGP